jgi:hypothetical protein
MKYKLLTENIMRVDELNAEVNKLLAEGWQLHGLTQLATCSDVFNKGALTAVVMQAMVQAETLADLALLKGNL